MNDHSSRTRKILFIGNYTPRKCGIATFTADLCESYALRYPEVICQVIAMNDTPEGYDYPDRVHFEIAEQEVDAYKQASEYINRSDADVICLQHEYGIFGGPSGSFILSTLHTIEVPVVTTLHTIWSEPTAQEEKVLKEIASLSVSLIVMTHNSAELLSNRYSIPVEKIYVIPHGIPEIAFIDPSYYKDQFAVGGKTVLLTFGLLLPNKGIEDMISALPEIVKQYPNVVYIVVGQTHPYALKKEGEHYRISLQRLAVELGVEEYLRFHNRFVSLDDLKEWLIMADIYVIPYLNEGQSVSGTLAYAFGAGNAVISTPFRHATELLADGKGVLVPFHDVQALSEAVIDLLGNDAKRNAMRKQAFLLGKQMLWPQVAGQYNTIFESAQIAKPPTRWHKKPIEPLGVETRDLPDLKIDHILRLTDTTGILRHARFSLPNFSEGYATDDNARALILQTYLQTMEHEPAREIDQLGYVYLAFLTYAFDEKTGCFRNILDTNRRWLEKRGSNDSHGWAILGLGTCSGRSLQPSFHQAAKNLFMKALPATLAFTSPRSWVFTILGIHEYLQRYPDDHSSRALLETLATRLHDLYRQNRDETWEWFEPSLTYANAKLPQALLLAGRSLDSAAMREDGLTVLRWLCKTQTDERNQFKPVGNTFYKRGAPFPLFDQQPIEAQVTVSACLTAYRATQDAYWHDEAWKAFQWFLGRNSLSVNLYDPHTCGCSDDLNSAGPNLNQSAESTLAFLLALAEMTTIRSELRSLKEPIFI